jgi:hypothetical protein
MRYDDYVPEIDYAQRGYKPVGGRVNHFCEDCVVYYKELHADGKTKREFPFNYVKQDGRTIQTCRFDKRLDKEYVRRENFDTDEDYEEALVSVDPVTWAYSELGWKPRWYQEEILCCTSQFKAIRAGRRVGKTASLSVLALWYAVTNKNFEVLLVCPFVAQVSKIMDNIRKLMAESPGVSNSVVRDVRSSPQEIEFANGSKIRGFAAGGSSSGRSDQIRGQDADLIIMDEVDYIADADIEVIMAILTSNEGVRVVVSSTPRGLRSRLFEWTRDKDGRWKEFWYISAEGPSWKEETEEFYLQMYSPGGYAREFLAEFGEEMTGVFRGTDLQKCIFPYKYEDCHPDNTNCTYTMGVDWNKITGTHICVIERPKTGPISYKLVDKVIIRKTEFTQMDAVRTIQELDNKWHTSYIYCDAGFGHTQVEMLWSEDKTTPHKNYRNRVKPIEMNSNIIIYDPILKQEIKKPAKPLMVYLAAHQVERTRVMFPKLEDTVTPVVPEELAYANIGIIQQARNFMVTKVSPTGRETFSQDYEHTLTAWMLGIMAHLLEYGDYQKINHDLFIGKTGPLGQSSGRPEVKLKDVFGQDLPPAQIKNAMDRLRDIRQKEAAERKANLFNTRRASLEKDTTSRGAVLNGASESDEMNRGSSVTRHEGGVYVSHKMGETLISRNGVPVKDASKLARWGRNSIGDSPRQRDIYGRRITRTGKFERRNGR